MNIENKAGRGLAIYFGSMVVAAFIAFLYAFLSKKTDVHLWPLALLPILYLTAIFGWFTYEFRT